MYFASFPKIYYDSEGQGNPQVVTNLLKRVAIRTKVLNSTSLYDTYDIKNGDTPESLADRLYNDSEFHWVILLVNNITDRYHQWPMYEQQFNTYLTEKYDNPDGVHHYEIAQTSGDTSETIEVYTTLHYILEILIFMLMQPSSLTENLKRENKIKNER